MPPRNPRFLSYDPEIFEHCGSLLVHAIFSHTWHLRTETGHILSLVESRWNGPLTMRITALPMEQRVFPGMVATLTDAALRIGTTILQFEGAEPWKGPAERYEALDLSLLLDELQMLRHAVRTAARGGLAIGDGAPLSPWHRGEADADLDSACDEAPTRGDPPDAWTVRGATELTSLSEALFRQDAEAVSRHAVGLLGLGSGLTPSGDDVLCGLLAGLSVLGRRSGRHRERCEAAVAALAACVLAAAPRRTTSLGATLLRSAARGVVVEPLLQVLGTMASGAPLNGIDQVLMLGHSSGSDMLTGALMAGATLVRWEEVFGSAMVGSR